MKADQVNHCPNPVIYFVSTVNFAMRTLVSILLGAFVGE